MGKAERRRHRRFRKLSGAKENIPYDEVAAVVCVGMRDLLGVMPKVKLTSGDDPRKNARPHVNVGVLKRAVDPSKDAVKR